VETVIELIAQHGNDRQDLERAAMARGRAEAAFVVEYLTGHTHAHRDQGSFPRAVFCRVQNGLPPDDVGVVARLGDVTGGSPIVDVTFPNGVVLENVLRPPRRGEKRKRAELAGCSAMSRRRAFLLAR
jgi:hypothetical protein